MRCGQDHVFYSARRRCAHPCGPRVAAVDALGFGMGAFGISRVTVEHDPVFSVVRPGRRPSARRFGLKPMPTFAAGDWRVISSPGSGISMFIAWRIQPAQGSHGVSASRPPRQPAASRSARCWRYAAPTGLSGRRPRSDPARGSYGSLRHSGPGWKQQEGHRAFTTVTFTSIGKLTLPARHWRRNRRRLRPGGTAAQRARAGRCRHGGCHGITGRLAACGGMLAGKILRGQALWMI